MICEFQDCPNPIKDTGKRFCSLSCSAKGKGKRSRKIIEKQCEECLSIFTITNYDARKKFCTRTCAARSGNKRRIAAKGYKENPCTLCGKNTNNPDKNSWGNKFCSQVCKTKYKVNLWLDGAWDGTTQEGLSSTIRRYLLSLANYKCQDGRSGCNNWGMKNEYSQNYALTIDHIDGDCYNNHISNLIVMCPNCHALTPTYGGLNRGNGRAYRRESRRRNSMVE